jgi:hypothetical protein
LGAYHSIFHPLGVNVRHATFRIKRVTPHAWEERALPCTEHASDLVLVRRRNPAALALGHAHGVKQLGKDASRRPSVDRRAIVFLEAEELWSAVPSRHHHLR